MIPILYIPGENTGRPGYVLPKLESPAENDTSFSPKDTKNILY